MHAKFIIHPELITTTQDVESYGRAKEIAAQISDFPDVDAVTVCVWDDDSNPTIDDPDYTYELTPAS